MTPTPSYRVERGKPAEYGQEIVKRRHRRTTRVVSLTDKLVLDYGCGNGAQTKEFAEAGCRIIAVDINHADLTVLSEYLRQQHVTSTLPVVYDGSRLPMQTESVDVVLSFEVIEHVADESQALREVYRVLKPGGDMVLSVPNKGWIFETHGARLPLLPWNRIPFFSWLPHSIHRRFARARIYRKRDIVELLEHNGFDVRHVEYITAPMDVVRNPRIKHFLRSTIFVGDTTPCSMLSTSILVHCVKDQSSTTRV